MIELEHYNLLDLFLTFKLTYVLTWPIFMRKQKHRKKLRTCEGSWWNCWESLHDNRKWKF